MEQTAHPNLEEYITLNEELVRTSMPYNDAQHMQATWIRRFKNSIGSIKQHLRGDQTLHVLQNTNWNQLYKGVRVVSISNSNKQNIPKVYIRHTFKFDSSKSIMLIQLDMTCSRLHSK